MQFNTSNHKTVAWLNLLFLAFFVAGVHWFRPKPVTVVSSQVETYQTLDHSEKLEILENTHNTSSHSLPLSLHFSRHEIELGPVILMLGLVMTLYSLLSANWVQSCNSDYSALGEFDIASVSTDGTAVMMDLFFWAVFMLFHAIVFLFVMKLCMYDELVFFLLVTTVFTWMVCCRILHRYSPVLFAAGFCLSYAHGKCFLDSVDREEDNWIVYFLLFMLDGLLLVGHGFDATLQLETALNCRVVYVFGVGVFVTGVLYF
jgi:hypothetical protein